MDAAGAACHALLLNLVSVRSSEEDARPEYMYAPRGDQEDATRLDLHAAFLAYWSVNQSGRLSRDVTCEHAALEQRAASAAPLDQAARVCLLIHVGVAQANSPLYLERPVRPGPFVSTVEQVIVGCRRRGMSCPLTQSSLSVYCGGGCSARIYVDRREV